MSIDVPIEGMTCNGCVASLKKVLERAGLTTVTVELGIARVPNEHDVDRVKRAIDDAGFVVASTK
jgi:copper chaperone CopZ